MTIETINLIIYFFAFLFGAAGVFFAFKKYQAKWAILLSLAGAVLFPFTGNTILMIAYFVILGILHFIIWNRQRPARNAMGWLHPDNGGGLKIFYHEPHKLPAHKIFYDWWSLRAKPIWLWYEEKDDNGNYFWKPYEPKPRMFINAINDNGDPFLMPIPTPRQLWSNADWKCARDFETLPSKAMEVVKMGMSIAMVAICVFGIFIILDMINKGPSS